MSIRPYNASWISQGLHGDLSALKQIGWAASRSSSMEGGIDQPAWEKSQKIIFMSQGDKRFKSLLKALFIHSFDSKAHVSEYLAKKFTPKGEEEEGLAAQFEIACLNESGSRKAIKEVVIRQLLRSEKMEENVRGCLIKMKQALKQENLSSAFHWMITGLEQKGIPKEEKEKFLVLYCKNFYRSRSLRGPEQPRQFVHFEKAAKDLLNSGCLDHQSLKQIVYDRFSLFYNFTVYLEYSSKEIIQECHSILAHPYFLKELKPRIHFFIAFFSYLSGSPSLDFPNKGVDRGVDRLLDRWADFTLPWVKTGDKASNTTKECLIKLLWMVIQDDACLIIDYCSRSLVCPANAEEPASKEERNGWLKNAFASFFEGEGGGAEEQVNGAFFQALAWIEKYFLQVWNDYLIYMAPLEDEQVIESIKMLEENSSAINQIEPKALSIVYLEKFRQSQNIEKTFNLQKSGELAKYIKKLSQIPNRSSLFLQETVNHSYQLTHLPSLEALCGFLEGLEEVSTESALTQKESCEYVFNCRSKIEEAFYFHPSKTYTKIPLGLICLDIAENSSTPQEKISCYQNATIAFKPTASLPFTSLDEDNYELLFYSSLSRFKEIEVSDKPIKSIIDALVTYLPPTLKMYVKWYAYLKKEGMQKTKDILQKVLSDLISFQLHYFSELETPYQLFRFLGDQGDETMTQPKKKKKPQGAVTKAEMKQIVDARRQEASKKQTKKEEASQPKKARNSFNYDVPSFSDNASTKDSKEIKEAANEKIKRVQQKSKKKQTREKKQPNQFKPPIEKLPEPVKEKTLHCKELNPTHFQNFLKFWELQDGKKEEKVDYSDVEGFRNDVDTTRNEVHHLIVALGGSWDPHRGKGGHQMGFLQPILSNLFELGGKWTLMRQGITLGSSQEENLCPRAVKQFRQACIHAGYTPLTVKGKSH